MDIRDKCQDGNKISTIMTLPEETMCEIFNYLSFETLYFSLRNVCKNLQIYVDHYLKLRGSSFLVGGQEGLETEVIEIIKQPGNGLIILRTPLSSTSFITSKLQHNASLDKHPARLIDKVLYAAMRESGVCYIYKNEVFESQKGLIYRYDLESDKWEPCRRIDEVLHLAIGETGVSYIFEGNGLTYRYKNKKWEKILENCTTLRCLDRRELSHESIQRLVSEEFPYYFEYDGYGHCNYPSVQTFYKPLNVSISKVMSCKRLRL